MNKINNDTETLDWKFFLKENNALYLQSKEEIFSAFVSLFFSKNNEEDILNYLLENFQSFTDLLCSEEKDWENYPSQEQRFFILLQIIKEAALRYNRAYYLLLDNPLENEQRLLDYLIIQMSREAIEEFRILFFNKNKKLILDELQTRGTINHTQVYPREISKRSIELKASYVILVHNHPSGDAFPSPSDIVTTQEVQSALNIFGIKVLDHYIIAKNHQISFKKLGLLSLHTDTPE